MSAVQYRKEINVLAPGSTSIVEQNEIQIFGPSVFSIGKRIKIKDYIQNLKLRKKVF